MASLESDDKSAGVLQIAMIVLVSGLLLAGCGGGGGGGGAEAAPPPPADDGAGADDDDDTADDDTGDDDATDDDTADDDTGDDTGDDDTGNDDGGIQPTLASIQENVFTPVCTECHAGASAPQGLRLEEGMSYGMLVNVASTEVPELLRVDPGNPDDSYLVQKLEGTAAVGSRMPLGGPFLSDDTIAAIRQWISDGAAESLVPDDSAAKTTLVDAWPIDASALAEAPAQVTVIADGELDTNLLNAGNVQLLRVSEMQPEVVEGVQLQVTSLSPTVLNLRVPEGSMEPGVYELRISGSGAMPVADRSGRIIDGDDDGQPGGDFVMHFTVGGE